MTVKQFVAENPDQEAAVVAYGIRKKEQDRMLGIIALSGADYSPHVLAAIKTGMSASDIRARGYPALVEDAREIMANIIRA
jgi:hypothetical protein